MFKKVDRSKKAQRKRKTEESDDDADDGNGSNLHAELQTTKKRRALIHQLQFKRGLDANDLLAPVDASTSNRQANDSNTSEPSGLGMSVNPDDPDGKSIWEKKHTAAMDEFVQNQLLQQVNESDKKPALSAIEGDETRAVNIKTKTQIYRELAAETARMGGDASATSTVTAAVEDTSKDVLTAGAATALAEVILPMSDRLLVVAETARAAGSTRASGDDGDPSHSIVQRIQGKKASHTGAIPNRFRSFHNHHHPLAPSSNSHSATAPPADGSRGEMDDGRLGFAAARQQQFQSNTKGPTNNKTRASDDRVYQQFVKRQREQQHR